jgi:hypothetical protein
MLSSCPNLYLPSCVLPWSFLMKSLYTFSLSVVHCVSVYFILPDLVIRTGYNTSCNHLNCMNDMNNAFFLLQLDIRCKHINHICGSKLTVMLYMNHQQFCILYLICWY